MRRLRQRDQFEPARKRVDEISCGGRADASTSVTHDRPASPGKADKGPDRYRHLDAQASKCCAYDHAPSGGDRSRVVATASDSPTAEDVEVLARCERTGEDGAACQPVAGRAATSAGGSALARRISAHNQVTPTRRRYRPTSGSRGCLRDE